MAKWLRRVVHVVMGLVLVLGLAAVAAWPITGLWRGGELSHWRVTRIQPSNGTPGYAEMQVLWIEANEGLMRINLSEPTGYPLFMADKRWGWAHRIPQQPPRAWRLEIGGPVNDLVMPLWLVGVVLLLPALLWFTFTLIVPHFRGNLRLRSNLCLHCGYHLINIDSDRCPECGAARPLVTVSGENEP